MPTRIQVTCIVPDSSADPDKCIDSIGGLTWTKKEDVAIREIEALTHSYFTKVGGKEATVIVVSKNGKKHLQTTADSLLSNNLLSLSRCPA